VEFDTERLNGEISTPGLASREMEGLDFQTYPASWVNGFSTMSERGVGAGSASNQLVNELRLNLPISRQESILLNSSAYFLVTVRSKLDRICASYEAKKNNALMNFQFSSSFFHQQ
jgi:Fe-S cluster biosynthesis and repair protein YggX